MTIEQRTLTVMAYRDPLGNPTCSASTRAGYTCQFLLAGGFGTRHLCGYGNDMLLRRGGPDGAGYLIPHDKCPLWADDKRAAPAGD